MWQDTEDNHTAGLFFNRNIVRNIHVKSYKSSWQGNINISSSSQLLYHRCVYSEMLVCSIERGKEPSRKVLMGLRGSSLLGLWDLRAKGNFLIGRSLSWLNMKRRKWLNVLCEQRRNVGRPLINATKSNHSENHENVAVVQVRSITGRPSFADWALIALSDLVWSAYMSPS